MAANFLHGVETIEINDGPRPVRLVKSSVVGLVGTAGTGPVNTNVLVTKYGDIAQFGEEGTIARELKRLFDQKPTVVIVRNVYDPAAPGADIDTVTAAQIIGGVDVVTGVRTGMYGWRDAYQQFGFSPKILIAPGFSSLSAVSANLIVQATAMRGIAFVDAPIGITPQQAITGRGPAGAINFNTSSDRVGLCYPHVKYYDPVAEA